MKRTHSTLIGAVGCTIVWLASMASCAKKDSNTQLTTNATMMLTSTTGMGGMNMSGGGGAGADGGGGTDAGTGGMAGNMGDGGQGGQGGTPPVLDPEPLLHGCTSTSAVDLTAATSPHVFAYPLATQSDPICLRISEGDSIDFNHTANVFRIVYGTSIVVKESLIPPTCLLGSETDCLPWVFCQAACSSTEPHYCPNSPFTNCPNPPAWGPFQKAAADRQVGGDGFVGTGVGVFPFYDDLNADIKGVVYVE